MCKMQRAACHWFAPVALLDTGQCGLDDHVAAPVHVMFHAVLKYSHRLRGPSNLSKAVVIKLKIHKLISSGG